MSITRDGDDQRAQEIEKEIQDNVDVGYDAFWSEDTAPDGSVMVTCAIEFDDGRAFEYGIPTDDYYQIPPEVIAEEILSMYETALATVVDE